MRCIFCEAEVLNSNERLGHPISLPTRGVAHSFCAEKDLIERRVFCNIHLSELPLNDLYELRELALTEINVREGNASDDVDLF
jgi:hypothetical protein